MEVLKKGVETKMDDMGAKIDEKMKDKMET